MKECKKSITADAINEKQEKSSNVMLLDFSKFGNMREIRFAYSIISVKGKRKTRYIQDAVKYYEENNPEIAKIVDLGVKENKTKKENKIIKFEKVSTFLSDTKQVFSYLRYLNFIKGYYNIKNRDLLENFLNLDKESEEYKTIKSFADEVFKEKKLAKMSCGFTKNSEEATENFEKFINMRMNDRVEYIANAIKFYVEDGMDQQARFSCANKIFIDIIDQYKKYDDEAKKALLHNLEVLFSICVRIQSPEEKSNMKIQVNNKLSDETKNMLWGKEMKRIENFLK